MGKCLDMSNVDSIINKAWQNVKNIVEKENWHLSSEKTLVFKFMWELAKLVDEKNLKYDFEYIAYNRKEKTDKFLDLLIWTDENYKFALEFKFPTKNNSGNSNQTETRRKIYKDISRLEYLVNKENNNIEKGYFLMATDEAAYTYKGNKIKYPELMVYHNYIHSKRLQVKYEEVGILSSTFKFQWENIKTSKDKHTIEGNYAWLKPIII